MSSPGYADFKGHHAPGGWGLQSGSQGSVPGTAILSPIYSRYSADKLVNSNGDRPVPGGPGGDLTVNVFGLFGWWASNKKLFGANWGMLGIAYTADNTIEYADQSYDSGYGLGGIYFQPLNLGWRLDRAGFMVSYGLYLPTGKYEPDGDDNSGLGMWTHEIGAGTTLYFDNERKMGFFCHGASHWLIKR